MKTLEDKRNEILKGFNEMKRVIEPEVIIIFGKLIKGMTGQFILFEYKDSFIMKDFGFKQLSLFPDDQIITIEEAI